MLRLPLLLSFLLVSCSSVTPREGGEQDGKLKDAMKDKSVVCASLFCMIQVLITPPEREVPEAKK